MLRTKASRARPALSCLVLFLCGPAWAGEFPQRIISLSPSVTEVLYGIGAFDRLVAVSDYCTWPPEVTKLPSVGGWHRPSLEKMTLLNPDAVLIDAGQAAFVQEPFQKLGWRVVTVLNRNVSEIYSAITMLGHFTGQEAPAARLLSTTRAGIERVARTTAPLSKPRVVLIVDRTPGTLRNLNTATAHSFYGALIETAGGRLVAPPLTRDYGSLSKEDLIALNPDVILDFVHGSTGRFASDPEGAWREMPELQAVRAGHVYAVNEDFVPHASQRIVQTAELFARLLHPELRASAKR